MISAKSSSAAGISLCRPSCAFPLPKRTCRLRGDYPLKPLPHLRKNLLPIPTLAALGLLPADIDLGTHLFDRQYTVALLDQAQPIAHDFTGRAVAAGRQLGIE